MIIRIEDIQKICNNILYAVDNSSTYINENIEIKCSNKSLEMDVTNSEYYVKITIPVETDEDFHATVNASLFLKLISQITTDTVEMKIENQALIIKGNGTYKIPLIYIDEEMLELPLIEIGNITNTLTISSEILNSIRLYNSKEFSKGIPAKPVQRLYYMDNKGAITFTSGACLNKFDIDGEFSVLLAPKIVKLFKLFDKGGNVTVEMGHVLKYDDTHLGIIFTQGNIVINALLPDSSMISSVPVTAIRTMAEEDKKFSVVINRKEFSDTVNRLLLFSQSNLTAFGDFKFTEESVKISSRQTGNFEEVYYESIIPYDCNYSAILSLEDLKLTLDGCTDQFITLKFGDNKAFVFVRGNIYTIIPESVAL